MSAHDKQEKGIRPPTTNRYTRNPPAQPAENPAEDAATQDDPPVAGPSNPKRSPEDETEETVQTSARAPKKVKLSPKKQKELAKKKAELDAELDDLNDQVPKGRYANRTPGAFNHCAECGNRFTYTKYTAPSSDGSGVLCPACQKEAGLAGPGPANAAPKKRTRAVKPKAPVQAGQKVGVKSLSAACIRMIAKHIGDIDELGEVGVDTRDNICKIVCKNRSLTDDTLKLFLDVDQSKLVLYDCANLDEDGLKQITIFAPKLKDLTLNYCGAFKDEVVDQVMARLGQLQRIELYGPYLVTPPKWKALFDSFLAGDRQPLHGFLLRQSPRFDMPCVLRLAENFPNLTELRLAEIGQLNDECLKLLHGLTNLEYLDLSRAGTNGDTLSDKGVVGLLEHVGSHLHTLVLNDNANLGDDTLIKGIRPYCPALSHLSVRALDILPAGFVGLFHDWTINPGLRALDLSRCLDVDDKGIVALMDHSGKTLVDLNLNSVDKDVTEESLKCIAANGESLERLDLGFVRALDDFLLKEILDGCAHLKWLSVWGCNRVTDYAPSKAGVRIVGGEGNFVVRD